MRIFWPRRSNAKGFSIKNLASKYPEKISNVSSNEISNKLLDDRVLESKTKDSRNIDLSNLSIKKVHWANRDFSEYREAA
tara:strand:+ start:193 stop:432 length:240 start_codon:yes stop_codon:yes gene_type:complete